MNRAVGWVRVGIAIALAVLIFFLTRMLIDTFVSDDETRKAIIERQDEDLRRWCEFMEERKHRLTIQQEWNYEEQCNRR